MSDDAPLPSWLEMRAGRGCPLCAPRPAITVRTWRVCSLPVSSVYLWRNEVYRGACTVVYDPAHATRPGELTAADWAQLCADIRLVETAITRLVRPDHINVELLGNTVPHLHASIIPRRVSDPRWGGPIWTTTREEMASIPMTEAACEELAKELAAQIAGPAAEGCPGP
jgi:diadenosine tetraphosphate (Ap4A) HIT family hydrolase